MGDEVPALKIDPSRAKLPQPSAKLFESMARAAFAAAADFARPDMVADPPTLRQTYDTIEDTDREWLIAQAKAMYAEVAKAGGARIEILKGGTE